MNLARITIRLITFAIASLLLACTASPRNHQWLHINGQPVLFSGYTSEPNVALSIQFFHWPSSRWYEADTTSSSSSRTYWDECDKDWYRWERRVTLPAVPPRDGRDPSWGAFWRGSLASMLMPEIRTRVVKASTGTALVSFDDKDTCRPSRNCGELVATECGNLDGYIHLVCPITVEIPGATVVCGE